MLQVRVIPCLLLSDDMLVKTVKFRNPDYVGDPVNAIKIYNDKEVDELIVLDILATQEGRPPNIAKIRELTDECFMPLCYGGGITTVEQMREVFNAGIEKVALNTAALENPQLVTRAAETFGSQSIVVSIDVRKPLLGRPTVHGHRGSANTKRPPVVFAREMAERGAGELLLTSVDREGTWEGYDLELIHEVTSAVSIPVIAHGGAGSLEDFRAAVRDAGASACATGSMVVYQKKGRGVLINFPKRHELEPLFAEQLTD